MTDGAPENAPNRRAQILELLKELGELTSRELNVICYRYSARIFELRQDGHDIQTQRIKAGLYRYIYHGQVTQ